MRARTLRVAGWVLLAAGLLGIASAAVMQAGAWDTTCTGGDPALCAAIMVSMAGVVIAFAHLVLVVAFLVGLGGVGLLWAGYRRKQEGEERPEQ
jgi:hypothetical protein